MISSYQSWTPKIHREAFIWPTATVIGRTFIGARASVWAGAVIRGDIHEIHIGEESNIQDLSLLHITATSSPLLIGKRVTVGHKVTLHSCIIEDECLIGMDSCIMDNAVIGKGSLVAAGAVVLAGSKFEPGSFIVGCPAVAKAKVSDEQKKLIQIFCNNYLEVIQKYSKR